ncbi:hypothetical protein AMK26_18205 [Streptomyces sp. CB03234]|uniref:hypothetical protein n=1 Tax=Streptomyces sp. (strain CB03234) TaxID=1703937 RepID=UPI00093B2FAB|nr:hypothetical protein [Streptomyces sp. CB03234]OKK03439.1 hypothetical protein AMK26_18205 [Streptomyces sp. CB03234]
MLDAATTVEDLVVLIRFRTPCPEPCIRALLAHVEGVRIADRVVLVPVSGAARAARAAARVTWVVHLSFAVPRVLPARVAQLAPGAR